MYVWISNHEGQSFAQKFFEQNDLKILSDTSKTYVLKFRTLKDMHIIYKLCYWQAFLRDIFA